ncbi:MAG TPA: hypothetical protein DDW90_05400 [Cyanobacteria bacterium UBA9971]|nr:hypothetical protein [Cyanobacteria bacterium UBA9971]
MLSKNLLNEIMSSNDVYDRCNIYESDFYKNTGKFAKKDYLEIRNGLEQYIKETTNNNLGKKIIEILM